MLRSEALVPLHLLGQRRRQGPGWRLICIRSRAGISGSSFAVEGQTTQSASPAGLGPAGAVIARRSRPAGARECAMGSEALGRGSRARLRLGFLVWICSARSSLYIHYAAIAPSPLDTSLTSFFSLTVARAHFPTVSPSRCIFSRPRTLLYYMSVALRSPRLSRTCIPHGIARPGCRI